MTKNSVDISTLTFGSRKVIESREYKCWSNMKTRCLNPKNNRYHMYGGRGISICSEWLNSFGAFFEDMGPCGSMSIERIDVNGNYEPGNCKWATDKEQQNNKTSTRWITGFGKHRTLSWWSNNLGVESSLLHYHLSTGRTIEQIVEGRIPVEKVCISCGTIFSTVISQKSQQKYCDSDCKETERRKRRVRNYHEQIRGMFVVAKVIDGKKLYARLYGRKPDGSWRNVQWYPDTIMAAKLTEEKATAVAMVIGEGVHVENGNNCRSGAALESVDHGQSIHGSSL